MKPDENWGAKMTKKELVDELACNTGYTKKDCLFFIDTFCEVIGEALKSGERVKIEGFGAFDVKEVKGRVGKNFANNKPMPIPDKKVPVFSPGVILKNIVGGDGCVGD